MAERVIPLELGVEWEPNSPYALLLMRDNGVGLLVLNPHFDDDDQRVVILLWGGCIAAVMQPPNDEALSGHPLYAKGLSEVLWAGEVLDSNWIVDLEGQNRVHPRHDPARFSGLRHFILPLKEKTVEVVANGWKVVRSERMLDPWYDIDAYGRIEPATNASEIADSWRARPEKPGHLPDLTEAKQTAADRGNAGAGSQRPVRRGRGVRLRQKALGTLHFGALRPVCRSVRAGDPGGQHGASPEAAAARPASANHGTPAGRFPSAAGG